MINQMRYCFFILTYLSISGTLILHAQRAVLPIEPNDLRAPLLLDSIENFPAEKHKVKTVKCFQNGSLLYVASFDSQGRITKLQNSTQPTRPITTTWRYTSEGNVLKKINGTTTHWEDRWYTEKGNLVFVQIRSIDSTVVIRRPDGALLDSAHYQNRKLHHRQTRKYSQKGIIELITLTSYYSDAPELNSVETYGYDQYGYLIHYSAIRGGQLLAEEHYAYNNLGQRIFYKVVNPNGNYTERIEYSPDGRPLKKSILGLLGDTTKEVLEIWEYDKLGRLTYHIYPSTFIYTAHMNYEYVRYFSFDSDDHVRIKWIGNNLRMEMEQTNGRIKTKTKYKYARTPSTMPEPGLALEADTLFLVETRELYDTLWKALTKTESFTYDPKQRIDQTSEKIFTYDSDGRLMRIDFKHSRILFKKRVGDSGSIVYNYNPETRLTSLVVLDSTGTQVGYSNRKYDNQGRLILLDSCKRTCARDSFAYDELDRITYAAHYRKYAERSLDTSITSYSYGCGKLTEITSRRTNGYCQKEILSFNPDCLPIKYEVIKENDKVIQSFRYEYEHYVK